MGLKYELDQTKPSVKTTKHLKTVVFYRKQHWSIRGFKGYIHWYHVSSVNL